MLVISGSKSHSPADSAHYVSISQSRCLSFQVREPQHRRQPPLFQSRNRDACHFRIRHLYRHLYRHHKVSISQSRCLSFQVKVYRELIETLRHRFNLAIEMLVISGKRHKVAAAETEDVSISQSRCLSFQEITCMPVWFAIVRVSISQSRCLSFQGLPCPWPLPRATLTFQSRNRDAYHFRLVKSKAPTGFYLLFQSRNRDAYHFRF